MRDFLGRPLSIGDSIIFPNNYSAKPHAPVTLSKGEITKIEHNILYVQVGLNHFWQFSGNSVYKI